MTAPGGAATPRNIGVFFTTAPHGGGSYQWALNILHALNDYLASHPLMCVHIVHYAGAPAANHLKTLFPDFRFIRIGYGRRILAGILRRALLHAPLFQSLIRLVFPYNALYKRHKFDLVLFPTTSLESSLCATRQVFFMADISHVFYPHFPEVSAGGELKLRHRLFSLGLAKAEHIVVESDQLKSDIVTHYHADPDRIFILPQTLPRALQGGIETAAVAEFILPARYIFYPAQLWEHKNHANLLRALKIILGDIPDLRLVLSGSRKKGDERIFRLAGQLGLQDRVRYLGYVPDPVMAHLYRNAEALVMPTFFGPTNIPTLEAFHFGCPAIISDLPGVTEQTGDAAVLFDPASPVDIAAKVVAVLTSPALRSEMIRKGRERAAALSYKSYRDGLFNVLETALGVRDFAIVLTGTIVPNAPFVAPCRPESRKEEYLTAIRYYRQFAPVYFLENSTYPLLEDPDFIGLENVMIRKLPVSARPQRGKGYQEFEMLDAWLAAEAQPPRRFLKITGRYRYLNFDSIFRDCFSERRDIVVIDQHCRSGFAVSQLMYLPTTVYDRACKGLFEECDDDDGHWIEKVLYRRFQRNDIRTRTFRSEPWLCAISGTSGLQVLDGRMKHAAKSAARILNRALNKKYLIYRR